MPGVEQVGMRARGAGTAEVYHVLAKCDTRTSIDRQISKIRQDKRNQSAEGKGGRVILYTRRARSRWGARVTRHGARCGGAKSDSIPEQECKRTYHTLEAWAQCETEEQRCKGGRPQMWRVGKRRAGRAHASINAGQEAVHLSRFNWVLEIVDNA